jgi:hypothetical protein
VSRIRLTFAFFIVGLLTTWVAMVAGSHMPLRFRIKFAAQASSGCYEIGPCVLPWWATSLLVAFLVGPALIFALTGWISAPPIISATKKLGRLAALIVITTLFYLASYAIRG